MLYSFCNLGGRCEWVVNATPRPLYPREKPGTHSKGGWVGHWAVRDGGKTRPPSGFDPRSDQPLNESPRCHWNFSFRLHYGPGVDSVCNINEYQEYFLGSKEGRCVGLTTLPPSCVDCLEIWEPQPPGTLRACPGL